MVICMNAVTGGISEWDLDWLGVAEKDGVVYGITDEALVSLTGSAEAGLGGSIATGVLTPFDGAAWTLASVRLRKTDAGALAVTLNADERGTVATYSEEAFEQDAAVMRDQLVLPPHDIDATGWQVELAGTAPWSLRALLLVPGQIQDWRW